MIVAAMPHLTALLFQLRDFWAGGAVLSNLRGRESRIHCEDVTNRERGRAAAGRIMVQARLGRQKGR
jgi:hypothetical protein